MTELPERGALEQTPLPRLLIDLYRARFTGNLELRRNRVSKRILLSQGLPLRGESSRSAESLGAMLREAGEISDEDAERLAEHVRSRGTGEAEAVLTLDLVPAKQLLAALQNQVRRCLREAFPWRDGEFTLHADASAAPGNAPGIDPIALVQEGLETHWSPERILAELGEKLGRYPERSPESGSIEERLRGGAGVGPFLEAMDGTHSLVALLQTGSGTTTLSAAWVLDALGFLVYRDDPRKSDSDDASAPVASAPEIEIVVARQEEPSAAPRPARGRSRTEGPRQGNEAAALRREVREKHERLTEIDLYQLLGVERKATNAQVRRAYFRAAKRFHPDALARLGLDDLKQQANEVFARIARAHVILSDPGQREEYEASLAGESIDADRLAQAEMLYRKAQVLTRAGKFSDALELLKPCVELWPEETAYQVDLGWALFKQKQPDLEAARTHLEQAVALDEKSALAHHRLHLVLRALGDEDGARRARATARSIDPSVS